jgi:hypothetical protein
MGRAVALGGGNGGMSQLVGVGPGPDRSTDCLRGVGGDVGQPGNLDVADHEGSAVVVLFDHQVGVRFGRRKDRADRGEVAHLAVPLDVVSKVSQGEDGLQRPVGSWDGVGGDPVG